MDKLRTAIHQFRQMDGENFTESWERFQDLLRKCPTKLIEEGYELQLFYKGLTPESRIMVNASAGGSLKDKTYDDVKELFQRIADNGSSAHSERSATARKPSCMIELDKDAEVGAQLSMIANKLSALEAKMDGKSNISCGLCQGDHHTDQCHILTESVNFVRDQPRPAYTQSWNQQQRPQSWNNQGPMQWQNQNPRTWQEPGYNQQWSNTATAGTSGINRGPPGFGMQSQNQHEPRNPVEDSMMKKLDQILNNNQRYDKLIEEQGKRTSILETNMKNMEVTMGQLAHEVRRRNIGGLPSDTEVNPKGKEVREGN